MIDGCHSVEVRQPDRVPLWLVIRDRLPVGRGGEGLVVIDDRVSRRHCELRAHGDQLLVADLGSSNGTFVNERRLGAEPAVLSPGDVVTIGSVTVVVDPDDADAPLDDPDLRQTFVGNTGRVSAGATPSPSRPTVEQPAEIDSLRASVVGGTITICFSDIVDSTALNRQVGDKAWFALLERHHRVLREQLTRHHGAEVKEQGDGFMLTFPSARSALAFAIAVQRALQTERSRDPDFPVHVRMGIHTGEAIRNAGDLVGRHVNLAARVAAAGDTDEIVASQLVVDLVSAMGDIEVAEPRKVTLKGFEGVHHVYPVVWQAPSSRV